MSNERLTTLAKHAKTGLAIGGIAWLAWSLMSSGALQAYIDKEMLRQWGPLFVLAMTALLMYDRNATRQINAMETHATAMRELALSVNHVAEKDDAFQREQDALLNHVAIEVKEIHTRIKQLATDYDTHRGRTVCRLPASEEDSS